MNKELEALEIALNWKAMTGQPMADEIIEALTPPTADEVCKALSDWINTIDFYPPRKVYYDDKKVSFEVGKYEPSICYKDDERIWFNWFRFPPHLITLIGRFYEGKK
jgi:hypothetical protein